MSRVDRPLLLYGEINSSKFIFTFKLKFLLHRTILFGNKMSFFFFFWHKDATVLTVIIIIQGYI